MSQEYFNFHQDSHSKGEIQSSKQSPQIKDGASKQGIFFLSLYFEQCLCIRDLWWQEAHQLDDTQLHEGLLM